MKRVLLILAICQTALFAYADDDDVTKEVSTSESIITPNGMSTLEGDDNIGRIRETVRGFDRIDERYIEPQHYVFTVMVQSTYTYDYYTLRSSGRDGQQISLSPDASIKLGPYFGWKWIFAGYTFTLGHSSFSKTKTQIDFSIYSSQIGVDLFYRRTGNDYKLRNAKLGDGIDTSPLEKMPFNGIQAGITGFNIYYIFNHGRFSYPAAFAQSTCQKISCGSWMTGFGYTKNSLEFDYEELQKIADEKLAPQVAKIDSSLMFKSAQYYDISLSGGYAYNWVFARNWLFCASGQAALAYAQSDGQTAGSESKHRFSFTKINPNFIGRFAIVYNNMRWYAGASAIVRSNYYFDTRFSTTNTFGSMNLYVGYNFGLKKKYRKRNNE